MDHTVPVRFSGYAGHGHRPRQRRASSTAATRDKAPFAFTGTIKKVVFDVNPHLTEDDEQALHEHAQQALAAHAMSA